MGLLKWPGYSGTPSGQWELIEPPTVVAGSAETSFDFSTTLADARWSGYRVEMVVANGYAGAVTYNLRANSNPIAGNRQYGFDSNTSVTTVRNTTVLIGSVGNGDESTMVVGIPFAVASLPARHVFVDCVRNTAAAIDQYWAKISITTPSLATEFTSLGILASQANGLGIGTVARLFGRVA